MKSLRIISKLWSFVNITRSLTLYYSMIYPDLIYGNIVWANTHPSNLHKLNLLKKTICNTGSSLELCRGLSSPVQKTECSFSIWYEYSSDVCLYINICFCLCLYHSHFITSSNLILSFPHIILDRLITFLFIKWNRASLLSDKNTSRARLC